MTIREPKRRIARIHLLLLGIILFLVFASTLYLAADFDRAQRAHLQVAAREAAQIDAVTQEYFDKYTSVLLALSELPCVRGRRGEQCDEILTKLNGMFPAVVNFAALDSEGSFFASGRPFNRQNPPSIRGLEFFDEVRRGTGPYIMNPHTGPISKEKVTGIILPLRTRQGKGEGFIGVSIQFRELQDLWEKTRGTSDHDIIIADRGHRVQYASPAFESFVGSSLAAMGVKEPAEPGLKGELSKGSGAYTYFLHGVKNSGFLILELVPSFTFFGVYLGENPQVRYLGLSLCFALILGFVLVGHGRYLAAKQKKAEEGLRESEERYADLYEHAPDMYVSLESSYGRIIRCNATLADVTGYQKDELIGRPFFELYHPDSREKAGLVFQSFIETGRVSDQELKILRKDGTPLDVSLNATAVRDADGRVIASRSVLRDITERKKTADELRRSEEKFRGLFLSMNEGCCLHEIVYGDDGTPSDYRITGINPAYVRITGISEEQAMGASASLLYGTGQPPYLDIYARVADTGEARSFETYFTPMQKHFLISAFSLGKGTFATIFTDVTKWKTAEQILRDSEERLSLALTAANQGLYDLNVQTGEAVVNDEYATMLGYDPATFEETNQRWRERLHPDDREAVYRVYEEYIAGKRSLYQVEFRQQTRSGEWIWILSIGKIVERDAEGRPLRMLGTHTNITERKRIEEEVRKLNTELEERVRERTEELEAKTAELERMNRLFVGRELKMKELKERIRELEMKSASPAGDKGTGDTQ